MLLRLLFTGFIALLSSTSFLYAQFVLNGTAVATGGECYQLTASSTNQAGSMLSASTIDLSQPFNEVVQANFGCSDGGADGIVFLFTTTNTALGIGGGGIGYQGITPSFAVEFDTWQNGDRQDPPQDHVAIISNGNNDHASPTNLAGPVTQPNLEDCMEHCVVFDWDPSTQTFSVTMDGQFILSYTGNIVNDIFGGNSNVFWGFTASTGGAFNTHTICLDSPTLVPMQDVTICEGESAQLQADPNGTTYSWAFDPTLSALDISNPIATPVITTTYDVTITYDCGSTATDDVTVFLFPPPVATAANDGPVCEGENINLFASGGNSYSWSGPNFSSNQQNPTLTNVTLADVGTYTVTVTDANGCTNTATTFVDVFPPPFVAIFPPTDLCENDPVQILIAQPPGGIWGGAADPFGQIDPTALGAGTHLVTYTFIDGNNCQNTDQIFIFIQPAPIVTILPAGPFCDTDGPQQLIGSPAGGIWGGAADAAGIVDPSTLGPGLHSVVYFFTDFLGCTGSTTTTILVLPTPQALIDPAGPFCEDSGIQTLTAAPPGGTWGGVANANGQINPDNLGPGTYLVTYTFNDGTCSDNDQFFIQIEAVPNAVIDPAGPFCDQDTIQSLSASPPGGTWGGAADANGQIDPAQLGPGIHTVTYTFDNTADCSDADQINIEVFATPSVSIAPAGPFCESEPSQTLSATPPGGTWGGVTTDGSIDPATLGPGTYTATYLFSSPEGCADSAEIDITILPVPVVSIDSAGPFCEDAGIQSLNASPPGGIWTGFTTDGSINPAALGAGTYSATYTFTNTEGCTDSAQINVTILPVPDISIDPAGPFCEDAGIQALNATPAGGIWGGVADANGEIDPQTLGAGTYSVTYSFTNTEGCTDSAQINVTILPVPDVSINPDGPFCEDAGIQSLNASPVGGSWGGAANSVGEINPAILGPGQHEVTYSFTNTEGCTDSTQIIITVNETPEIQIDPAGPFCENAGIQDLSATPPGGSWSGAADSNGQVDPAGLGAGMHWAIYSFTTSEGCFDIDSISIEILPLPTAILSGGDTICEGNSTPLVFDVTGTGVVTVIYTIDGVQQPPILINGTSFPLDVSEAGSYAILEVTDETGCTNTGSGTAEIVVVNTPMIVDPEINCETDNTSYTVSFEIAGGDPSSYTIVGNSGTLTQTPPYTFTSAPILNGNNYNIMLFDQFGCDTMNLMGSFSCDCLTEVGEMDTLLISVCGDEAATALYDPGTEFNDGNDIVQYVLHTSSAGFLGNILMISDNTTFFFDPAILEYGEVYYISAIFGNPDSNGEVDLDDPCLSVAPGTPVIFNPIPVAGIEVDSVICLDEMAQLNFSLEGNGPFDLIYTDGDSSFTLVDITNGHTVSVSPAQSTTYSIVSFEDNSDPACQGMNTDESNLLVNFPASTNPSISICAGDSVFLAGGFQTEAGTYTDIFNTINGCDSTVTTELIVNPLDTTLLFDTNCDPSLTGIFTQTLSGDNGCDSTIITSVNLILSDTTYIESNTCDENAAGIFTDLQQNQQGCDSLVIETVTFLPPDTTYVTEGDCDIANTGVFTETLTNAFGCDSLIITIVNLLESDTTFTTSTSCDPDSTGTFSTLLNNEVGCDSLVIETVNLLPSDTVFISSTSCDPEDIGIFETLLSNQFGCDSLVVETVTLLPSDTTFVFNGSCNPANIGVFETLLTNQFGCDSLIVETVSLLPSDTTFTFDASCNPSNVGEFQTLFFNQFGCDSLIIHTVSLLPSDTTFINDGSCNPAEVGTFFNIENNQFGCDSLIITTISLIPKDTTYINNASCEPEDTGVFTTLLSNQSGCDSLIIETVNLLPSDTTFIESASCDPDDVGIFNSLLTNQFGCDSLIVETVSLLPSDTTFLTDASCDPNDVGVFNTLLTNQFGCDSLIVETVSLLPSDTTFLFSSTCDSTAVGVFSDLLNNQFNCDSLVIETVTLLPNDTTFTSSTTCDPDEEGVFLTVLSNQDGCDSLVFETIELLDSDTTLLFTESCNPADTGLVTLNLINEDGCDSTVFIFTQLSAPEDCPLDVIAEGDDIPCDENSGIITLNIANGQGPYTYSWTGTGNPPSGSGTIPNASTPFEVGGLGLGNYSITITSSDGLITTVESQISPNFPPEIGVDLESDYNGFGISCIGNTDGSAMAIVENGGEAPFQYVWSNDQTEATATELSEGWHFVTVIDANNCEAFDSVFLSPPPPLDLDLIPTDLDCNDPRSGVIEVAPFGGVMPYQYSIDNGPVTSTSIFTGLEEGPHEVLLIDANECSTTQSINLLSPEEVLVELGDDQIIKLGDIVELNAQLNFTLNEIDSILWPNIDSIECIACPTIEVQPYFTQNYQVNVFANNGCRATDEVTIYVDRRRNVFIPNTFSPDGDSENDRFTVYGDETMVLIKTLRVFDRWGNKVFETNNVLPGDISQGWDGRFKEQKLNPAVFVYYAEVEFFDGFIGTYKGDVTIVK